VLTLFTIGNPAGVSTTTSRNWDDFTFGAGDPRSGNFNPDCDMLNSVANGECSAYLSQFGTLTSIAQFNEETRFGWGNRAYNWEFSTSVQHEVAPRVGIDVGYFRRWFGNFQVTQTVGLTAADYDRYTVRAPADSRLPDGGGYSIGDLYNLNPGKVGVGTAYTTLARDFGEQIEHWNGRMAWSFRAASAPAGRPRTTATSSRTIRVPSSAAAVRASAAVTCRRRS
jgi:hypothetical protein